MDKLKVRMQAQIKRTDHERFKKNLRRSGCKVSSVVQRMVEIYNDESEKLCEAIERRVRGEAVADFRKTGRHVGRKGQSCDKADPGQKKS